jgi:hypothetical protein
MKFQKLGVVTIDNGDGDSWTFQDPFGEPIDFSINFATNTALLTVRVWDNLNEAVKTYSIPMDAEMGGAVYALFQEHVRRIAKETYPEFFGLDEIEE